MKKSWWKLILFILAILAWTGAVLVAMQLLIGYLMIFLLGKENFTLPVWSAVYSAVTYAASLTVVILVPMKLWKKWKVTRKDLGLQDLPTWTDVGLAPIGYIAALLLSYAVTAVFSNFSWFDAGETQNLGFNLMLSGWERVVAFITLVVVAPIAEEIIFRGWLYGLLREKTSASMKNIASIILSSLLTSILFGAIHMQWNVAVDVFCVSIVLCALREITGTIYAGILVHVIKNGLAFYLLYMVGFH